MMSRLYQCKQNVLSNLTVVMLCVHSSYAQVLQVAAGQTHTCALLDDATVKCWGYGQGGLLGYGDTGDRGDQPHEMGNNLSAVDLGTGSRVAQLAVGEFHSCVLLNDGTMKCWGNGNTGMLGSGDTFNRGDHPGENGNNLSSVDVGSGRTVVQIAMGNRFMCVLLDDATVKCWGTGSSGMLGYGDPDNRGDEPGEMGDNLPSVDLGAGRTAVQIAAGGGHSCAILDDATVKCWGSGSLGMLGYGDQSTRGNQPGEMGDNLPSVDLGTGRTAVQIAIGNVHTCAILDDETVKCWGFGPLGQLGYGDTSTRGDEPEEMGDNLSSVNLGTGRTAVQISAGNLHTCVLLNDATVKCWGFGFHGALGYGNFNSHGIQPGEMGDDLPTVDLGTGRTAVQVSAGSDHTCALLDDDTVKCWGIGLSGRLGYGDILTRGTMPGQMGDNLPSIDLGSNITKFPTVSPSAAPSESPTQTPTALPSSAPSLSPTLSSMPEPSLLNDPAVIGGITSGAIAIVAAAGFYVAHKRDKLMFLKLWYMSKAQQDIALKA